MRIAITKNAKTLFWLRHEKLLNDTKLPLSVRQMISVHMAKPWIPDFWSVAIRPTGSGSKSYLDFEIGRADETPWYFPSRKWWLAHAKASHPPEGKGCDVAVHVDFLTSEGKTHEFDYATITTDDRLTILHHDAFKKECRWWREYQP
jgi:hypothetical protein